MNLVFNKVIVKKEAPLFCAMLILLPLLPDLSPLIAYMNSKFVNFIMCGK